MPRRIAASATAVLFVAGLSVPAQAQPLEIDRSVIAGGGGALAGGPFSLIGTIGQYDAGPALSGGAFELTGGFWPAPADPACNAADLAAPLGVLDFSDVIAFLTGFASMDASSDLAAPTGVWDFSDVIAFLSAFGAGCP